MSAGEKRPGGSSNSLTEANLEYAASMILNVFRLYDVDKGGTLQRRELRQLLRQCGAKLTSRQCEDIIEQLDSDGDGEMNFAEFMAFLGRLYQVQFFGTDPGKILHAGSPQVPPRPHHCTGNPPVQPRPGGHLPTRVLPNPPRITSPKHGMNFKPRTMGLQPPLRGKEQSRFQSHGY